MNKGVQEQSLMLVPLVKDKQVLSLDLCFHFERFGRQKDKMELFLEAKELVQVWILVLEEEQVLSLIHISIVKEQTLIMK